MEHSDQTERSEESRLGARLFNQTWELLDQPERTPNQDAEMIHTAHASVYHWLQAPECTASNIAIGNWQVSRVYAVLGMGESALYHARLSLETCQTAGLSGFELGFAHEAIARAAAAAGDRDLFTLHFNLAEQTAEKIEDAEDRELLMKDLHSGPWYGLSPDQAPTETAD